MLLLIAGAIVNVAVAWGCTRWGEISEARLLTPNEVFQLFTVESSVPSRMSDGTASHGFGIRATQAAVFFEAEALYAFALMFDAGWPAISVRAEWRAPPSKIHLMHQSVTLISGIETTASPRDGQFDAGRFTYPSKPIWPGFAINTIFYAAILWVVFFAPGKVKLRRRRNLCPACAYPVGASPVCTECGAAIPSPLREGVRVRVDRTDF